MARQTTNRLTLTPGASRRLEKIQLRQSVIADRIVQPKPLIAALLTLAERHPEEVTALVSRYLESGEETDTPEAVAADAPAREADTAALAGGAPDAA